MKSFRNRSYSGAYSAWMRNNTDQNNSVYGTFHAVISAVRDRLQTFLEILVNWCTSSPPENISLQKTAKYPQYKFHFSIVTIVSKRGFILKMSTYLLIHMADTEYHGYTCYDAPSKTIMVTKQHIVHKLKVQSSYGFLKHRQKFKIGIY